MVKKFNPLTPPFDETEPFSKRDATTAPSVTNDVDEGYIVGSRWIDVTANKEYVCLDNTDGAAVWTETTGGGGSGETIVFSLTNKTGAQIVSKEGYVYRLDPDNDNAFDIASEDEDAGVAVKADAVTIEIDATANMVISGVDSVFVDGVVDADISEGSKYLYFSTTAGQAKVTALRDDGCFGECIEDSSGAGLVQAVIYSKGDVVSKFQWSYEQGARGTFFVPIPGQTGADGYTKHGGNPIITPSESGWDELHVSNPEARIFNGILYVGISGRTSTTYTIGYAKATNAAGTAFGTPVQIISNGTGADKDADHALQGRWFEDEFETDSNKRFKMVYRGQNGGTNSLCCAFAADPEGSWTKDNSGITQPGDFLSPGTAVRFGNAYYLLYQTSGGNLAIAMGPNYKTWTKVDDVVSKGAVGEFDDGRIENPSIFINQGRAIIFYSGEKTLFSQDWKIGIARGASDQLSTFEKWQTASTYDWVLGQGAGGAWDSLKIISANAIQLPNGTFNIYFAATDSNQALQIGVATCP